SNPIQRRFLHVSSMTGITPTIAETYSEDLKNIISQMLSCDPKDRPSANEILAKPFLKDAVNRNRRIPDQLEERFMKSTENFDEAYKHSEAFLNEMEKTADSLEEIHRKCTIGSLSGAVIGATGGITALVGAILAPFTLGASLIVTGVGIGVSVAGGVTGAASNITDTVKQKSLSESLKKMEQICKNEGALIFSSPKTLSLLRKITKFSDFVSYLTFDNVKISWRAGRSTAVFAAELACLLVNVGRVGAQAAKLGRAAVAVSGVLSGLLVIVDGIFIAKDSQEIHEIRQQGNIDDPEKVKSSVLKSIAKMRKTHKELCAVLKAIKETRESILKKRRKNHPEVKETRFKYTTSQTHA
ncbi:apolipoprotein L3-like, partial [Sinocyclocheilus rhinocerous]|uniref:apolipoprotein L3-like n=1 Tax=Sinocyclocheilus rhinocerous TaxID=307959 RepID=UPI0007B9FBE5